MRHSIFFLTLIGLSLTFAGLSEAQDYPTTSPAYASPPYANASYPSSLAASAPYASSPAANSPYANGPYGSLRFASSPSTTSPEESRPYYVAEAGNGNEAYPKIETNDLLLVSKSDTKSSNCRGCGSKSCECPPVIQLELDWLSMSRGNNDAARDIFGGPGAANFGDLGFTRDKGYRARAAAGLWDWELEGVYTNMNPWTASSTRQLTRGVSFDSGINTAGAWLGQNFINQNTLFSPIFEAASGGAAADEFDGFGPGDGVFLGDAAPTLVTTYRSELDVIEANLRPRDFVRYLHGGWRVGMGYAHVTLEEFASASLTGTFRALDTGIGPFSGGLTHADLTDPAEGNLTLISGPGTGFDDETGGTQAPDPDTLTFLYEGTIDNTMNGAQILFDALLYSNRRVRITSSLKGGVYDNHVQGTIRERYTEVTGDGDVYGRDFSDDTHQIAFLGTVGLAGAYGFNDWLFVRGGYEVNFLSGVALATEQVVANGDYNVNADGSLITHGFNAGIEARY